MISAPFSDSLIAPQLSHVPDLLKFAKQIHSSQLHKHTTEMSFLRIGLSVTLGASLMHFSTPPLLCETKRRFYDDENAVNPVPGTVTKSAGTELEAMGPSKLVDGASVRTSSTLESAIKSTSLRQISQCREINNLHSQQAPRPVRGLVAELDLHCCGDFEWKYCCSSAWNFGQNDISSRFRSCCLPLLSSTNLFQHGVLCMETRAGKPSTDCQTTAGGSGFGRRNG